MDGFDDLLAPSRRILEDNPFADPFAKRSGSPDPWASPFVNPISTDDYGQSAVDANSTADTFESSSSPTTDSATPTPSDPLEFVDAVEDEDHQGRKSPSPGFRESVEPTVRTTEPEEEPSTSPVEPHHSPTLIAKAETPRASTPSSPTSSQGQHVKPSASGSRIFFPSPSTSKSSTEFLSPLERRSAPIGVNQSIAGLSLGGESLGGWQGERAAWGDQAEDDSDDDKPISQTVRLHEHGDHKIVSRDVGMIVVLRIECTLRCPPLPGTRMEFNLSS